MKLKSGRTKKKSLKKDECAVLCCEVMWEELEKHSPGFLLDRQKYKCLCPVGTVPSPLPHTFKCEKAVR